MRGLLVLVALAAGAGPGALRAEEPARSLDPDQARRAALLQIAQRQRAGVVSIQVRGPGGVETRRQAVVVDADGWLLMAGPTPGPKDTLVARVKPDTYVPASVVARDPDTALTLLQVLPSQGPLQAVTLPPSAQRQRLPLPAPPGTAIVLVTSDGSVALGSLRAADRRREVLDGARGVNVIVPGLLEAGLAVLAEDLGAPWFDAEGHLVGLLVGGVASEVGPAGVGAPDLLVRAEPVAAHALPSAVAGLVWPLLEAERTVRRSRLGVRARPGTEATLAQLCPTCGAHVVDEVDADGPAQRAGLERMDLIVAIAGSELRRGASLAEALLPFRPLDTVRVRVLRRGQPLEVEVVLGER